MGVQICEVVSCASLGSGQAGWVHFSIGDARSVEVRVRWPGEGWSKPYTVEANGFTLLDKVAAIATALTPAR